MNTNNKKMSDKKMKAGQRLRCELLEMRRGDMLIVPYRLYSANNIKTAVSKLNASRDLSLRFSTQTLGEVAMKVTRIE